MSPTSRILRSKAPAEAIAEVSRLARANGLERIVLLSGRGEPGAQRAEAALQQSGVPWTVVQASWFDQNFSEGYLLDGVLAGEIALPVGAVGEPFIDADDIAEVVVAALTDRRHASKVYEVTGPRALTFAQAAAEIARAAGRPVHYRQIGSEQFAAGMRQHVPEEDIALLLELFTVVLDGRIPKSRRASRRRSAVRRATLPTMPAVRGDRRVGGMNMRQSLTPGLLWFSAIGCGLLAASISRSRPSS